VPGLDTERGGMSYPLGVGEGFYTSEEETRRVRRKPLLLRLALDVIPIRVNASCARSISIFNAQHTAEQWELYSDCFGLVHPSRIQR
jgi:hypothetical protein